MLIDIEKIVVRDRIRKDFGDIEELADDIRQNGLINPPVINKDNVLLAGERRLLACKALGWKEIEVRVMNTRDAEHELNVEISENESRKEFSKAERADYMRRLMRIEQAKAKERQNLGLKSDEGSRADDATAKQFGIGRDTMRKEMEIVEHKDLIPPEDFADWDEGKLSTNKVFQNLKSRVAQTDREIKFYKDRIATLEKQKTQTVEVAPDDYKEVKSKAKAYDAESKQLNDKLRESYKKQRELEEEIRELKALTNEDLQNRNLNENVYYFCAMANNFVGNVGGLVWLTERIADMPKKQRDLFMKAANALRDFSVVFAQNLERGLNGEQQSRTDTGVSLLTDSGEHGEDFEP